MSKDTEAIALRWWQSMFLSPQQLNEKHIKPAPSVYKAQLKRCENIDAVMMSEGFRALWLSVTDEDIENEQKPDIECWATVAAALVYVKLDIPVEFARAAGAKGEGDKAVVSELRFAQLQNAKTPDEFLRRLRRILQQIKGEVSVTGLVRDIQKWFSEQQSWPVKAKDRISLQWAMDYYRAAAK
ncbi:type I-E CRISPR-associated protein Cse2/CasB [Thalassomonas viridans]|uniref:Type I-E CRISPR-associated protein Cse2/CasB n=1 Tax=Thalassomonas viridans TaxID=137584 RepID=A0AAE9Z1N7_9GAMM|nr:type I-E CRISPR-associated protein Cse2/CasB [Thalassomonas viridans]WDE04938.1 type I-E CRISPR-associated protein Cse2/CasB [Thalassomonas viridans]